jgi:hypothetical protein
MVRRGEEVMGAKLSLDTIITRCREAHGEKYDYHLLPKDIKTLDRGTIICPIHGEFKQIMADHYGGKGCRECGKLIIAQKKLKTWDQFLFDARAKHDDRYTYPNQQYKGSEIDIIIVCSIHGSFPQRPANHLSGAGCRHCGIVANAANLRLTIKEVVDTSNAKHDYYYDYSLITNINNVKDYIDIICPTHGIFSQQVYAHMDGNGCNDCGNIKRHNAHASTLDEMIVKANAIHHNKYSYPDQEYINGKTKIQIICPKHGSFWQTPNAHISKHKHGCPTCGNGARISAPCIMWLDLMGVPNDPEHREVRLPIGSGRKKADGFDPITNTVYEFYGDYYHGNLDKYDEDEDNGLGITYGELYEKTMKREKLIKQAGYKLITMWESDFLMMEKEFKARQKKTV